MEGLAQVLEETLDLDLLFALGAQAEELEYQEPEFPAYHAKGVRIGVARKPLSERNWECIHENQGSVAGFPHFYYYSNPQMAVDF